MNAVWAAAIAVYFVVLIAVCLIDPCNLARKGDKS